jgi:hypothetical protein
MPSVPSVANTMEPPDVTVGDADTDPIGTTWSASQVVGRGKGQGGMRQGGQHPPSTFVGSSGTGTICVVQIGQRADGGGDDIGQFADCGKTKQSASYRATPFFVAMRILPSLSSVGVASVMALVSERRARFTMPPLFCLGVACC